MNVIITMAGMSKRFSDKGFKDPKFKIITRNKSLFEWSMLSLIEFFSFKFFFIAQKEHECREFITEKCSLLGIKNFYLIEIDYVTNGQAETVTLARDYINQSQPLLIYNIDTHIKPGIIHPNDFVNKDGLVYTVIAEGNHWSFFKVNEHNKILEAAEKVRISNNASIGLYYFKNWLIYNEAYMKSLAIEAKEMYISNLYNYLSQYNIFIKNLPTCSFHPIGTPEELTTFTEDYNESSLEIKL